MRPSQAKSAAIEIARLKRELTYRRVELDRARSRDACWSIAVYFLRFDRIRLREMHARLRLAHLESTIRLEEQWLAALIDAAANVSCPSCWVPIDPSLELCETCDRIKGPAHP